MGCVAMCDVRCTIYEVRSTMHDVPVDRRLQSTISFNLQIACFLVSSCSNCRNSLIFDKNH